MAACLCGELCVGRPPLLRRPGHAAAPSEWRGGQAVLGQQATVGSPGSQHAAPPCEGAAADISCLLCWYTAVVARCSAQSCRHSCNAVLPRRWRVELESRQGVVRRRQLGAGLLPLRRWLPAGRRWQYAARLCAGCVLRGRALLWPWGGVLAAAPLLRQEAWRKWQPPYWQPVSP
jgi:hypothetical protein